jgi:hypothetical protein
MARASVMRIVRRERDSRRSADLRIFARPGGADFASTREHIGVEEEPAMRFPMVISVTLLLGGAVGAAMAADGSSMRVVTTDNVVPLGATRTYVTITDPDTPPEMRPRASIIVYAPDGTMMRKPQSKRLSGSAATFKVLLGSRPQPGTYSVYATTEAGTEAFGKPATFQVLSN